MNILTLHKKESLPQVSRSLYDRMEQSLKTEGADFEKSVRIARVIAPMLQDRSSNERHLAIIASEASIEEKTLSIIMLGFPKNREALPVLRDILLSNSESLCMAAAIAISQMADENNQELLTQILMEAFHKTDSVEVRKTIRKSVVNLLDKKSQDLINSLFLH